MLCFSSWRFEFLIGALPSDWNVINNDVITNMTLPQTMIWENDRVQVFWEYHDGVIDEVPRESVSKLVGCWKNRNPKKTFVYVKPNLSTTRSATHLEFAKSHGFSVLTCPRWSYFNGARLHDIRHQLREMASRETREDVIKFMGDKKIVDLDKSVTFDPPFSYGLAGCDLSLFGCAPLPVEIVRSDRFDAIKHARSTWGKKFQEYGILTMGAYMQELARTSYVYQPHGVGPRHATYESMMMGRPSVIPENSYLDELTRGSNVIASETLPSYEWISTYANERRLSEACIDVYETYMTPNAIVNNVVAQLKNMEIL